MGLTSNTGFYNPAAEKFGVDDPVMVKAPRMKYQFKLEFVLNENVFIEDASFSIIKTYITCANSHPSRNMSHSIILIECLHTIIKIWHAS